MLNKTTKQLENMNTAGQVELSLEELEQVIGGEPAVVVVPRYGHCDNCGNDHAALIIINRFLHDRPFWRGSSGLCIGCVVNRIKNNPEVLQQVVHGTLTAASIASVLGGYVLPPGPFREICKIVRDAITITRECPVA
jgi:hypothetical protein